MHEAVVLALRAAGGEPLLLPPHEAPDPDWLEAVLARVDGLVVTGGAVDLHPSTYGEPVLGRLDRVDEGRAALELGLCRRAFALDLPVLGLCGGMQTLAVAAGGRLCQDIATFLPGALEHEQPTDPATPWHEVLLEPGPLRDVYGTGVIRVNSTHHQAVSDPGALTVAGRAPDGVVEALWLPGRRFAVGVQWHPEHLHGLEERDARAPFFALIAATRR